ncbi:MAG: DUF3817 domain-containing protein [Bdellovibrionales bacterium]|nr:DUF3817 domain-containing protein [Bdellovibrionales bacterium]
MNFFLWLGRFEGISVLILFFVAMPLKYMMGLPEAVRWVGMIHGILFLMYIFTAYSISQEENWPGKKLLMCVLLSSLPFGTFYFESRYLKPQTQT